MYISLYFLCGNLYVLILLLKIVSIMPKINKRKVRLTKQWGEEDIAIALSEITAGNSIRSTAAKYGMSEGILRHRMKQRLSTDIVAAPGRPTTLSNIEEEHLAKCIGTICKVGFSPTCSQIKDLVKEYVEIHQIDTPFRNNRPGKDWLRGFILRNNLSLKKANMISSARKSATSNPFVIFDFYDVIEKIIEEKNLKAENIWNCDESGFPHDPQKCRVVSVKGEVAYKVTCGSGRENTTTLAVVSAAGRVMDPLIIFSGKNFQSTWRGKKALPDTVPDYSASLLSSGVSLSCSQAFPQ